MSLERAVRKGESAAVSAIPASEWLLQLHGEGGRGDLRELILPACRGGVVCWDG